MKLLVILIVQVSLIVKRGLGAVEFVDPPSGSVIANLEGAENVTTISCNVTDGRELPVQLQTRWSIQNFRGIADLQTITDNFATELFFVSGDPDPFRPSDSFRNRLTILRLTSELDGVTVYCGIGILPQQAKFHLRIIAIPGPPRNLSVDGIEATSIQICWEAPFIADSPITYYSVSARNLNVDDGMNDIIVRNTTTNSTFYNVTGLLPGTTYELTVVAVSQGGDFITTSQPSSFVQFMTTVTVPALSCHSGTPKSINGAVTVTWSYFHTGGLPLINVSVTYVSNDDSGTVNHVPISGIDTTSVEVLNLVVGFEYTFNITAANGIGKSSISCGPILHRVGRPVTPMFGELVSGPDAGEVTIMIKTVASGLENPTQVFWFVVTPYTDGTEGEATPHLIPNYQSGTFATIIVGGLEEGERYRFNATATNIFGASGVATSNFIIAGVGLSTNIGAIVGGVVGGISVLFILTLLAILLLAIMLRLLQKRGKVVTSQDETEPEYEVPDFPQPKPKGDVDIELTECPAYGRI